MNTLYTLNIVRFSQMLEISRKTEKEETSDTSICLFDSEDFTPTILGETSRPN